MMVLINPLLKLKITGKRQDKQSTTGILNLKWFNHFNGCTSEYESEDFTSGHVLQNLLNG